MVDDRALGASQLRDRGVCARLPDRRVVGVGAQCRHDPPDDAVQLRRVHHQIAGCVGDGPGGPQVRVGERGHVDARPDAGAEARFHVVHEGVLGALCLGDGAVDLMRLAGAGLHPAAVLQRDHPALDLENGGAEARPDHEEVDLHLLAVRGDPLAVDEVGVVREPGHQRVPHRLLRSGVGGEGGGVGVEDGHVVRLAPRRVARSADARASVPAAARASVPCRAPIVGGAVGVNARISTRAGVLWWRGWAGRRGAWFGLTRRGVVGCRRGPVAVSCRPGLVAGTAALLVAG